MSGTAHATFAPEGTPPPGPTYSHGVRFDPGCQVLQISGQVPMDSDGTCSADGAAQADRVFANLGAVLDDAGMTTANLVHIRCYLVDRQDLPAFQDARDRFLKGVRPAATLVFVSGLGKPEWRIEVEALAARPMPAG
ncbi:MAG: RidA family protein [Rhodobacter sp.]|nr:RidA family protein [Rhodobacter sp.]